MPKIVLHQALEITNKHKDKILIYKDLEDNQVYAKPLSIALKDIKAGKYNVLDLDKLIKEND